MSETSDTRTSEKTAAIVSPQASKPSPWLAKSLLADSKNDGLRPLAIIGSNALTLAILFVAFRAVILRDDLWGQPLSERLSIMSHGAFQDMIFASLLGGGGALCALILSPPTVAQVFRWVCALFVLWGASNVMAMRLLSEPVTWAWDIGPEHRPHRRAASPDKTLRALSLGSGGASAQSFRTVDRGLGG